MGHLTVGGKLDTEAQLLTEMYTQLLRHAGFDVTEKAKLGTNDIVHNAIVSGQIDLYPEFTATGLARLKLTSTHDDQQDYALVKAGYEKQFHITWLAMAPLNDTYGICSTQARAGQLHATKISDLGVRGVHADGRDAAGRPERSQRAAGHEGPLRLHVRQDDGPRRAADVHRGPAGEGRRERLLHDERA